ncbi:MAG TPA: S8 family peptidase, partial [Chitinivibrionales bacterium]
GDVEDVVTVGAVATDKSLAYSSSRGPTADGRIKPDLAAPGTMMYLPSIYSAGDSAYDIGESGTSFAAPLVAGICAMIAQTHPTYDAAAVRRCLYASCAFAPRQKSVDNGYGRGIPNALVACRWADTQKTAALDIALYPTTIFTTGNKQKLTLTLTGLPDNPPGNSQPLKVTIMSVDGKVLWSRSDYVVQNAQLSWGKNFWPQNGALHPPGMYYCAVHYAGKTVIKKFIIAG